MWLEILRYLIYLMYIEKLAEAWGQGYVKASQLSSCWSSKAKFILELWPELSPGTNSRGFCSCIRISEALCNSVINLSSENGNHTMAILSKMLWQQQSSSSSCSISKDKVSANHISKDKVSANQWTLSGSPNLSTLFDLLVKFFSSIAFLHFYIWYLE